MESIRETLATEVKYLKKPSVRVKKNAITEIQNRLYVMTTRMEEAKE